LGQDVPRRIVVVGGGTAGWMAAAALVSVLPARRVQVTLIESEAIGIIGVGEATLPHLRQFNETIGIDEAEFLEATSATMKLGIEFVNWARIGDRYVHPFGDFGADIAGLPFHQAWSRMRATGNAREIGDYSLPVRMCAENRFERPADDPTDFASRFGYAYQFDATRYAPFLRQHAEARGASRVEGIVNAVHRDPATGNIHRLDLDNGQVVDGDFFFDCTGFRGVLIEQALNVGYEDWSHWLPCNRAIAVPSEKSGPTPPYTRATAHQAGWQWRIPLQHRTGNGHVYASDFTDDDTARQVLLDNLEGNALADPRPLRFTTGRRKQFWSHNCISVGLAGGFLEPLESTSIHLTQIAITQFIELFPVTGDYRLERDSYNAHIAREFERVRDFLILHYHATERTDSAFWNYVRTMPIPDSLAEKMALFRETGRVARYQQGLFLEPSWLAVYLGQRVHPNHWDGRLDVIADAALDQSLNAIQSDIESAIARMPDHDTWLARLATRAEDSRHG